MLPVCAPSSQSTIRGHAQAAGSHACSVVLVATTATTNKKKKDDS